MEYIMALPKNRNNINMKTISVQFITRYHYAVLSTVSPNCLPESALVDLPWTRSELICDT